MQLLLSERKIHLSEYQCGSHDRYIVIDEIEIYHPGHSLGELGEKTSSIARMREQTVKKRILDESGEG